METKTPRNIVATEMTKNKNIIKTLLLIARIKSPVIERNNIVHIANNSVFLL